MCHEHQQQRLFECTAQGVATLLQHSESQLHASRRALAAHISTALLLPTSHQQGSQQESQQGPQQGSQPFITSGAYATLCDSATLITRLAGEAQVADQQHSYSSKVPVWKEALAALQAAAAECVSIGTQTANSRDHREQQQQQQQQVGESGQSGGAEQKLRQQWQEGAETLVKGVLVWAQNIKGKEQEASQEAGMMFCNPANPAKGWAFLPV